MTQDTAARWSAITGALGRAAPSPYRYPDVANEIELKLPSSKREEELSLWEAAVSAVAAQGSPQGFALDAGCGPGLHLPRLAERFEAVAALEPDERRAALARARCPSASVHCLELPSEALAAPELSGAFRLVQCLQVLGHTSHAKAAAILRDLRSCLAPDGMLLLAVPYTNAPHDDLRVSLAGVEKSQPLTSTEYEELADSPRPGVLPVHHFTVATLEALAAQAGVELESVAPYGFSSYQHADLMVIARAA